MMFYEVWIEALAVQNELTDATAAGLNVLRLLGVEIPGRPTQGDILAAFRETRRAYQAVPELIDLPLMTDPVRLAAMRALVAILPVTYLSSRDLFIMLVLRGVSLSVTSGNTAASANLYASYGLLLCGVVGEIELGWQFGQLALELLRRLNARELAANVNFLVHGFIAHWRSPVKDSLAPLRAAYHQGLETGDLQFAKYAVAPYCT